MGPDRRIGIALIVVAALALIVVNRVSGRDVPGEAVALPPLPPPGVGACIDSTSAEPTVVPCTELHTGEVIESWPAGQQPETTDPTLPGGACRIGFGQLVSNKPGWAPPPLQVRMVDVAVGGPIGWAGCLQVPAPAGHATDEKISYIGRLLQQDSVTDYPPQLRTCFVGTDSGSLGSPYPVPCDYPHEWELLAVASGVDRPIQACADLARTVVGSQAAFAGDRPLAAAAMPYAVVSVAIISTDGDTTGGQIPAEFGAPTNCAVRAPAGSKLVGSVVGLGDDPVPFE